MSGWGAFWFGVVIGYVTYRTLQHKKDSAISDIAAVIGAIGGSAIVSLIPGNTPQFDDYAFGLAIGFFSYLLISLLVAARMGAAGKNFLGDTD